jgi:lipopolysaccharide export system permease protein
MRRLNRYIFLDYLVIFLSALGLVTFVMSIGAMLKAVDLVAKGISPLLILKFFLQNLPFVLSYSMPISTLFAALLLFGRLSMDSEISAMKACGISLWRVVAPLIALSVLFSAVCMHINCNMAPESRFEQKKLLRTAGVEEPINLLEEGRFTRVDKLLIYVGRKNGHNVKDIVVHVLTEDGQKERTIRAARGEIKVDEVSQLLEVRLYDGVSEVPDHDDLFDVPSPFESVLLPPIDIQKLQKEEGRVYRKNSYLPMGMLINLTRYTEAVSAWTPEEYGAEKQMLTARATALEAVLKAAQEPDSEEENDVPALDGLTVEESLVSDQENELALIEKKRFLLQLTPDDLRVEKSRMVIEANRRVALAVACFTFMLIGIPLGVKSHRKETSIGMVMSLGIVFVYYIFIILAESLAQYPGLHPNLILWLPLVATQILGLLLIRRSN